MDVCHIKNFFEDYEVREERMVKTPKLPGHYLNITKYKGCYENISMSYM